MPYYAPATAHPLIPVEVVQQLRHLAGCDRAGRPPCEITGQLRVGSALDSEDMLVFGESAICIFHNGEELSFPLTDRGLADPDVDIWNDCVLVPWTARAATLHPDEAA